MSHESKADTKDCCRITGRQRKHDHSELKKKKKIRHRAVNFPYKFEI